jgi:hypothetical protein
MNTSYNCTDFIGLSLDSDEDYEPYGYGQESLQTIDSSMAHADAEPSIEAVLFAGAADRYSGR